MCRKWKVDRAYHVYIYTQYKYHQLLDDICVCVHMKAVR